MGSIPGLGRSPGEGNGYPGMEPGGLQFMGGSKESDTAERLTHTHMYGHEHVYLNVSLDSV